MVKAKDWTGNAKSLLKVLEQQLLMVGMFGKRVLQENQLLNGYKGVTDNDKKICISNRRNY